MPARAVDIRMVGGPAMVAAFQRLEVKTQRKIARRAMRSVGKFLLNAVRAIVPVASGTLKRTLKVRALRRSRRGFGVVVQTGTREQLGIPENATGYYPMAVEAGTEHMKGQSYLRRAFDENRAQAEEMMRSEIGRYIDEEWNKP